MVKKSLIGLVMLLLPFSSILLAQTFQVIIKASDNKLLPIEGVVVELKKGGEMIQTIVSKKNGEAVFEKVSSGSYDIKASFTGYEPGSIPQIKVTNADIYRDIQLKPSVTELSNVTVQSSKPFIQRELGKLIINPDASPTSAGTTVVELLEKSPGVAIDRNGGISLRNKSGVLVLIDDKPTYLQGAELINLLNAMNSSQVEKIELITNPSAKYDAAGNSGIINIKTKKSKQAGLNGTLTLSPSLGSFLRSNNTFLLNYRNNKWGHFFSYGFNFYKIRYKMYSLRTFSNATGASSSFLEQFSDFFLIGKSNTIKYATEFTASNRLTFVASFAGTFANREDKTVATADWLASSRSFDSSILTNSVVDNKFSSAIFNVGTRHKLTKTKELNIDIDAARYQTNNEQYFESNRSGSISYKEATFGSIPAGIKIFSVAANYTSSIGKESKLDLGLKTSKIDTDNEAAYTFSLNNSIAQPNYGMSNHFLYSEQIRAVFGMIERKFKRLTVQTGLRYESTSYDAHQLGNIVVKDSTFSRQYAGFFPSTFINYEADSVHTFSVSVGRRINRPSFQSLNPFVNIINKYTFTRGNPFFRPQFTWNFELSHQYKQLLHTTFSYSLIKDYFSQLYFTESDGTWVYTQGNIGRMHSYTISTMLTTKPTKWWSLNTGVIYSYKKMIGYEWNNLTADILQLTLNMNNQFKISKSISGEITGNYNGRSRFALQEVYYPSGHLSAGLSMPVMKKSGTLRCSIRDIFYTSLGEGLTELGPTKEYFKIHRDTRLFTLSFSYRFGKTVKAVKQKTTSDEMRRAGG